MKTKITAVLLLTLVACSKSNPKPVFDLAGKWSISSPTISGNITFKRYLANLVADINDTTNNFTVSGDGSYHKVYGGYDEYYTLAQREYGGYSNTTNVAFQIQAVADIQCLSGSLATLTFGIYPGKVSTDFKIITFITTYHIKREGCNPYYNTVTDTLVMTRVN